MSLVEKVVGWLKDAAASVRHGEVICARCVRVGDGASPGSFGDYGLCPRCLGSVTSTTLAFLVEHLPISTCEPLAVAYRCAVCREVVKDGEVLLETHHCSNLAIQKVLDLPVGRTTG